MHSPNKIVRFIKKLHKKITPTFNEYETHLKVFLSRYGYVADVFPIMPNVLWHIVVYDKETNTLIAVIKVGFKGNNHCTTYNIKLYLKEKTIEKDFIV